MRLTAAKFIKQCSFTWMLILSAVMMLEYFGWQEAADIIEKALEESFADGRATNDLARFMPGGKALPTSVFAKEITEKIQKK